MAKKQKKTKSIRKYLPILIPLLVIALAFAGFGIYRLATYQSANHAERMSESTLTKYNQTVSSKAIASGNIRPREIVLLQTLTKTQGQDSVAVFSIYQLPAGVNGEDYMHLRADDVDENSPLEYMGTFTCRIVSNQLETIYDMKAVYVR